MTLREQLSAATVGKFSDEWHAAIIYKEEGGKPVPVFVRGGQIVKGVSCYHIQKIGKETFLGETRPTIQHFRLQKNDELIETGYQTITHKQREEWIERHKAQIAASAPAEAVAA